MITLSSFYIGQYEITQAEFQAVMGWNPSQFAENPNRPVDTANWFNAIEYCNRRSIQEELTPCYSYSMSGTNYGTNPDNWPWNWNNYGTYHINVSCNWSAEGYRLPTEMEWMFAAMGGNQSQGYPYSGSDSIGAVAWYFDNSDLGDGQGQRTHDVGLKNPNELGTFDMSGNVSEVCWDIYASIYPTGDQTNPTGPTSGSWRLRRGGDWYTPADGCCVWYRALANANTSDGRKGFRCARNCP